MKPLIDPERDLFRPVTPLRTSARIEPIVGHEVGIEKVPADHLADSVTHLREG